MVSFHQPVAFHIMVKPVGPVWGRSAIRVQLAANVPKSRARAVRRLIISWLLYLTGPAAPNSVHKGRYVAGEDEVHMNWRNLE